MKTQRAEVILLPVFLF